MIVAVYKTTYQIDGREIVEVLDVDATLEALMASNSYVIVFVNEILRVFAMNKLQRLTTPDVDLTLTLDVFLEDHLTDLLVDILSTDTMIPLKDMYTGRFNKRVVTLDPMAHADYHVSYTSMKTPTIRDDPYHQVWANDLVITSDTDLTNSLVAVNGLFHRTVLFEEELFVAGGYANIKRAGTKEMLLVDTTLVGGHTTIPITEEMIIQVDESPLKQGFKLRLPGETAFTGKTAMLVIHGQLYLPGRGHKVVGPQVLKVNTNQVDLVSLRVNHPMTKWSRKYRLPGFIYQTQYLPSAENALEDLYDDTSPLYADPLDLNGVIDTDNILSNEAITSMLVAGQSFIVLLNTPQLYMKRYHPWSSLVPGQYAIGSQDTPRGILIYDHMWALPYTILSAYDKQHHFTVAARRIGDDAYKTTLDQEKIEAPWLDSHSDDRIPALELVELYRS